MQLDSLGPASALVEASLLRLQHAATRPRSSQASGHTGDNNDRIAFWEYYLKVILPQLTGLQASGQWSKRASF